MIDRKKADYTLESKAEELYAEYLKKKEEAKRPDYVIDSDGDDE